MVDVVERFPWMHLTPLNQLHRLQYLAPVQLSGDDLASTAKHAVQAVVDKIAVAPGAHPPLQPRSSPPPTDPDALLSVLGVNLDRVRMAVLSVMVSLFRSYRMYIQPYGRPAVSRLSISLDRDELVADGSGLRLAPMVLGGETLPPAPAPAPAPAPPPKRQRKRLLAYGDVFRKEEFLAEQTHEESRELLRYCVTTFMPFPNFISERCEWTGEPDLFDRYAPLRFLCSACGWLCACCTASVLVIESGCTCECVCVCLCELLCVCVFS